MAQKLGNGGHSQENYDPKTGKYVSSNTNPLSGLKTDWDLYKERKKEREKEKAKSQREFEKAWEQETNRRLKENGIDLEHPTLKRSFYTDKGRFDDIDFDNFEIPEELQNIKIDLDSINKSELDENLENLLERMSDIDMSDEPMPLPGVKELTRHEFVSTTKNNPRFWEAPRFRANCQRCIAALEMRLRGFNVTVTKSNTKITYINGHKHDYYAVNGNWTEFFKSESSDIFYPRCTDNSQLYDAILKYDNGQNGRYVFQLRRPPKNGKIEGHVFNILVKNREVYLLEGQRGHVEIGREKILNYLNEQDNVAEESGLFRVDDKQINENLLDHIIATGRKR